MLWSKCGQLSRCLALSENYKKALYHIVRTAAWVVTMSQREANLAGIRLFSECQHCTQKSHISIFENKKSEVERPVKSPRRHGSTSLTMTTF